MRSNIQKTGVALVALIGLILTATGCSPVVNKGDKFDASSVSCNEVSEELKAAKNDPALESAQSDYANAVSSIAQRNSERQITSLEEKIAALETRATECESEDSSVVNDDEQNEFVIKLSDRGPNGRFFKDGVPKDNTEKFRKFIAAKAKHDLVVLYAYYVNSPLQEKYPLKNEASLAKGGDIKNGNVYSDEGVQAYERWLLLWEVADLSSVKEIGFQGFNTGVNKNKVVQQSGVDGDLSGYNVAYKDASGKTVSAHSVLNRCGNPTTGDKPDLPPGKTDNEPKSSNPADYRQPGDDGKGQDVGTGKRPKSEITEKAEKKPSKVKTKEKNSHTGVTDSSDKKPGSETGGDAKGTEKGSKSGDGSGTGNGGSETYPDEDDIPKDEGGNNGGEVEQGGF